MASFARNSSGVRQDECAVARPLHLVREAAVLAHRGALQRERRTQDVAKELLTALVTVLVDAHSGVQGPAVEVGAPALMLERSKKLWPRFTSAACSSARASSRSSELAAELTAFAERRMTRRGMASTSSSEGAGNGRNRVEPSSAITKAPSGSSEWKWTLRLSAPPKRWIAVTPPGLRSGHAQSACSPDGVQDRVLRLATAVARERRPRGAGPGFPDLGGFWLRDHGGRSKQGPVRRWECRPPPIGLHARPLLRGTTPHGDACQFGLPQVAVSTVF